MKTCLACLVLLIALPHSVSAQDHLEPDVDAFVDPDSYLLKIRHIFARAFDEGVILRALVLPSFRDEYAVGLKQNDNGIEAFVLETLVDDLEYRAHQDVRGWRDRGNHARR